MEDQIKRGPGLKKGKPTWQPASRLDFLGKEDGYRYHVARKDPDNLAKKKAEGWENVSALQSPGTEHQDPNKIEHGKPLSSVLEGTDWILQRMPEDLAQARDEYMDNERKRRVSALTAHIGQDLNKAGAEAHGEITISTRKGN